MQARSKLKPGQKGIRKLVELSGSRLGYIRYRYGEQRQMRFKTVELIVEETPWTPKTAKLAPVKPEEIVGLKIAYGEVGLGRQVKAAGGKWNQVRRLWEIRYDQVARLGLEERIQKASNTTNQPSSNGNQKASNTRKRKASDS